MQFLPHQILGGVSIHIPTMLVSKGVITTTLVAAMRQGLSVFYYQNY